MEAKIVNLGKLQRILKIAGLAGLVLVVAGCALTMRDQPRYDAFEQSAFFEDNSSARLSVADTVARGQPQLDEHFQTGRIGGDFAPTFPFTVTLEVVERGQERYNIFCTPCHGPLGDGQGIVIDYGMRQPDSFHSPELRAEPVGYYFDLISRGTRVMPSYAARISPQDRWAIVAYVRALQLSQNADLSQVPPEDLPQLEE